jgi:hypothetical protein
MFKRMATYTVHLLPEAGLSAQKPIFLKEGFNILAFLFPLFWALYYRLWLYLVLLMGYMLALMLVAQSEMISMLGLIVLELAMHVYVGMVANDWLREKLGKKGYLFSDVTIADSRMRAEQRYFDRCFAK